MVNPEKRKQNTHVRAHTRARTHTHARQGLYTAVRDIDKGELLITPFFLP